MIKRKILYYQEAYGVHIIDAITSKTKLFLEGGKDLIEYPNYMYIYKDLKGRYWIGGWGGMNRFENFEDLLARKSKEYKKSKGNIPFRGFITMYEDSYKTLWVGTTDGLYYYEDSEDKFIKVLQDRLKRYVMFIGNISKDKLIIGIDAGLLILQIDNKSKEKVSVVKLYNNNNGYDGLEPGQNGLFTDSKGRMWVTSGTVLSFLDVKKLNLSNEPLRPYFQKIDNRRIEFNSSKNISIEKNTFTLKIGSIGFNRPQKTLYSHKIDGNDWSEWISSDLIFIKPLSHGQHVIKIRAKTEGIAEDRLIPVVLNVNVTAPFYQSPNFAKYLGFISAILFGWFLYSFFKSRYEKRKLLEKERTINYLQIQTLQAQLNPHFLFNALSSLQNLILKNETALANKSLTKLASLMRRYLESSVAANNPRVRKNEISLKDKIELLNSYLELESIQHEDKFSYKIEYPSDLQLDSIKLPPLIIQPFVENAVKHGLIHKNGKGNLTIKFENFDETLICTIDDDGIGRRASADLKKQSEHSYKSFGTRLVQERVKLLNESDYDIKIETIDKIQGTTVIIKIQQKYED
ncbi:MAG: histidine kinase [Cytophagaceae bacterium]|nr:histidine kinase [Cytophagaceae bacterium]